uniref:Uncharacterized protein n=1 Tax=Arundo donax TaxID=35708 RepID=A0A0A8YJR8_ARUDO
MGFCFFFTTWCAHLPFFLSPPVHYIFVWYSINVFLYYHFQDMRAKDAIFAEFPTYAAEFFFPRCQVSIYFVCSSSVFLSYLI